MLLGDVRLDGKQRTLIQRFGGALSDGMMHPPPPSDDQGDEQKSVPKVRYVRLHTRRQRRQQRKAAAEATRAAHGAALQGSGAARGSSTRAELAALEQAAQLDGLERWLADDDSLWLEDTGSVVE